MMKEAAEKVYTFALMLVDDKSEPLKRIQILKRKGILLA